MEIQNIILIIFSILLLGLGLFLLFLTPEVQRNILKKIRYTRKLINLYFKLKKKVLPEGFFIHSIQNAQEEDEMYKLRHRVYCEEFRYLDPKDYPKGREKDIYDPYSIHFVIVSTANPHRRVVGTIRIIRNSELGFPLEKNFKLFINPYELPRENIIEVSRLVVDKEYRIENFMLDLVREIYHYAKRFNISHIYSVMDDRLYIPLRKMGFPFKKIGETKKYQGITTPYLLLIREAEENLYKNYRKMFNFIIEGLESRYRSNVTALNNISESTL